MRVSEFAAQLKPFVQRWIDDALTKARIAGAALRPHALNSDYHTGTLADWQAPQFVMLDGSRTVTGNIPVATGITIDGVDISVFKSAYDAHLASDSHTIYASAEGSGTRRAYEAGRLNLSVLAGNGLSGGGLMTTNRTLSVDQGYSFTWTAAHAFNAGATVAAGQLLGFGASTSLSALGGSPTILRAANSLRVNTFLGVNVDPTSARLHVKSGTGETMVKLEGTTTNFLAVDTDGSGGVRLGTSDFFSGQRGWRIDGDGSAEFNNIVARGELHASVFVADEMHATGGTLAVLTTAKVAPRISGSDNTLPGSTGSSFTLVLQASYDTGFCYFADNDVIRVKTMLQVGGGLDLYDIYLEVNGTPSSNSDRDMAQGNPGTHDVPVIWRQGGSAGLVIEQGTGVVKWGQVGGSAGSYTGGLILTSDAAHAPYMDIFTIPSDSTPWSISTTPRVRVGKLDGITDLDLNPQGFGLYAKSYTIGGETAGVYIDGTIVAREGRILDSVYIGGGSLTAQHVYDWTDGVDMTVIDGGHIKTNTISAHHLNVGLGGGNLLDGANWDDDIPFVNGTMPEGWVHSVTAGVTNYRLITDDGSITGIVGRKYLYTHVASSTTTASALYESTAYTSVDSSKPHTLSIWGRTYSGTTNVLVGLRCYNSSFTSLGEVWCVLYNQPLTSTPTRYHATVEGVGVSASTFFANTKYVRVVIYGQYQPGAVGGSAFWDVQLEPGDVPTAWAPGLRGNVQIDSRQILVGTPGAQRIVLSSGGLKGYNSGGTEVTGLDSATGLLTATGATIRSSASGARIEMSASKIFGTDGTTTQWEALSSTGKLTVAGGKIVLDSNGILGSSSSDFTANIFQIKRITNPSPEAAKVVSVYATSSYGIIEGGEGGAAPALSQIRFDGSSNIIFRNPAAGSDAAQLYLSTGNLKLAGRIATANNKYWDLQGYTAAGDAASNGYVTVVIDGTTYKLSTRA